MTAVLTAALFPIEVQIDPNQTKVFNSFDEIQAWFNAEEQTFGWLLRIPAKADTDSDDGGHPRSVATQAG